MEKKVAVNFRHTIILVVLFSLIAGYVYFYELRKPTETITPPLWFYETKMERIIRVDVTAQGQKHSFVRGEGLGDWFFNTPEREKVNLERWGGITLLLSGPQAKRLLTTSATEEELARYGLGNPDTSIDVWLTTRILVFAEGDAAKAAREAGADHVGSDDYITKVKDEAFDDFDMVLATPEMMPKVRSLAPKLEPKGLYPKAESGTVVAASDLGRIVKDVKEQEVRFTILLGFKTPDGLNHYAQFQGYPYVYLVDGSWGEVLARLVAEPPYIPTPTPVPPGPTGESQGP